MGESHYSATISWKPDKIVHVSYVAKQPTYSRNGSWLVNNMGPGAAGNEPQTLDTDITLDFSVLCLFGICVRLAIIGSGEATM